MQSSYEAMPHGSADFPMAVYSERVFDAPLHHHKECEIFCLAEGRMSFGIGSDKYEISAGDVLFVEPNIPHYALQRDGSAFHHYAITFDADILGNKGDPCREFFESVRINRFLTLDEARLSRLPDMRRWCIRGGNGDALRLKAALLDLITHIIDTKQYMPLLELRGLGSKGSSGVVSFVMAYVSEHYREKISLDDLTEPLSYSKSQIIRIFKSRTGMNIVDYINRYRIEKACLEILSSSKTSTEIAINNGFSNAQYFTKVFHDIMGVTPKEFYNLSADVPRLLGGGTSRISVEDLISH